MGKCKHPYSELEERTTIYGEQLLYCRKCHDSLRGWSHLWRKYWLTVVLCAIIFAAVQTLLYFLF